MRWASPWQASRLRPLLARGCLRGASSSADGSGTQWPNVDGPGRRGAKLALAGVGALGFGVAVATGLSRFYVAPLLDEEDAGKRSWLEGARSAFRADPVAKVFRSIDANGDGVVDRLELRRHMLRCGIMDMTGFAAIWKDIDPASDDFITLEEFQRFYKRAHSSFAVSLWQAAVSDPTFAGSFLYLSGSVLFAVMTHWTRLNSQKALKLAQGFYVLGGVLFLSQCLQRHSDRLQQERRVLRSAE